MSLRAVAAALMPPQTDADLVGVYVPGGSFGGPRPDAELFRSLYHEPPGQRIIVRGESGSGKTSLILRVIGDVGALDGSSCEPFRITVGDVDMIESVTAFLQSLLGTIASQEGRFANIDAEVLAEAAAIEQTTMRRHVTHRVGLHAPVSYQAELKEPVETFKTATTPTQLREHLNDILARIAAAGFRPLVVIDDTDRFARLDADGRPQVESIYKLLTNAVHVLCEAEPPIDVIVAVHPRYADVDAYEETRVRFGFTVHETPRLPVEDRIDPPPLAAILERRLRRHRIEEDIAGLIDREALIALEAVYVEREGNMREVLRVAQAACLQADADGAAVLGAQHVFAAQRDNPPAA
jgi:Cdc6-like AAA superfamily ATPase